MVSACIHSHLTWIDGVNKGICYKMYLNGISATTWQLKRPKRQKADMLAEKYPSRAHVRSGALFVHKCASKCYFNSNGVQTVAVVTHCKWFWFYSNITVGTELMLRRNNCIRRTFWLWSWKEYSLIGTWILLRSSAVLMERTFIPRPQSLLVNLASILEVCS